MRGVVVVLVVVCVDIVVWGPIKKRAAGIVLRSGGDRNRHAFFGRDGAVDRIV